MSANTTEEEETDQAFVLRLFDEVRDAEEERQNSPAGIALEAVLTKKREAEFASGKSGEVIERDTLRRGEGWKRQGNAYLKIGDPDDAILCYSAAIRENSGIASFYNNRAQAALDAKRWKMAETDAMTAASLEVLNVKAWIRRAKACRAQGNFPDASKYFKLASILTVPPGSTESRSAYTLDEIAETDRLAALPAGVFRLEPEPTGVEGVEERTRTLAARMDEDWINAAGVFSVEEGEASFFPVEEGVTRSPFVDSISA